MSTQYAATMAVISRIIYYFMYHVVGVISDIISYSFSMHHAWSTHMRRISHKVNNKSKYHLATADTIILMHKCRSMLQHLPASANLTYTALSHVESVNEEVSEQFS